MGSFMREWESLYESKSGERGIFNRQAARKTVERNGRRGIEITIELEDGNKKVYMYNERVKTKRGLVLAGELTEEDELV